MVFLVSPVLTKSVVFIVHSTVLHHPPDCSVSKTKLVTIPGALDVTVQSYDEPRTGECGCGCGCEYGLVWVWVWVGGWVWMDVHAYVCGYVAVLSCATH